MFAYYIIIGQILGLIAMIIDIWGTTIKNDRKLTITIAGSSLIFAIHFLCLSASVGAINEFITTIRSIMASYYKKAWLGFCFLGIYIIFAYTTITNLFDLFPFLASILGTIAMYWFSGVRLRILFTIGQICWLVYSLHTHSIGGVCLYIVLILGTLRTGVQLWKNQKLSIDKND